MRVIETPLRGPKSHPVQQYNNQTSTEYSQEFSGYWIQGLNDTSRRYSDHVSSGIMYDKLDTRRYSGSSIPRLSMIPLPPPGTPCKFDSMGDFYDVLGMNIDPLDLELVKVLRF